jgi:transcriptional regulator with XRE-family HTH domain
MNATEELAAPRADLSRLVRERRAERRLSLRAAAERTVDPATGEPLVKYGWLNNLEKERDVTPPSLRQLKALATALDIPFGRLQDAAGSQFLGIDSVWSSSGEARALVERADRLTPEQRDQLMRFIDSFAPPSS